MAPLLLDFKYYFLPSRPLRHRPWAHGCDLNPNAVFSGGRWLDALGRRTSRDDHLEQAIEGAVEFVPRFAQESRL